MATQTVPGGTVSLYKRGSIYWCRWRIGGAEVRETAGTSDPAEAQEYHDRRRADLWRARKLGERRVDWDEAALAWVEDHAKHKRSYYNDILKLRWLQPFLTGKDLLSVTPEVLQSIRDAKIKEGRSISTANKHLATVSAVLHHAARSGKLRSVPWIPYLRAESGRVVWITQEQAQALILELPDHLASMTRLALATGLRRANVTGLEWGSVDLGRRMAWVWPDEAKSAKAIPIPLNDDAVAVLREQIGEDPRWVFTYRKKPITRTKTKAWDAAVKRAECPKGFRFHDLRHTWATWHVMAGTPLDVLMKLGGWASYSMVLKYAHFSPGHLAGFADRVVTKTGTPVPEVPANVLNNGVADGIRTHDNWNHKQQPSNVHKLNQELTETYRTARRRKQG